MLKKNSEKIIMELMERYPVLAASRSAIISAVNMLTHVVQSGGKILVCGNGGSSADADHIVGELMKGFLHSRPLSSEKKESMERIAGEEGRLMGLALQQGIPAVSLSSQTALITAFMNDVDPTLVFAQQIVGLGNEKDLLWGLSTSGNSANIVSAAIAARSIGMKILGMTGGRENRLSKISDVCIRVNEDETYKVQELQLPVYHVLCLVLENELFNGG